MSIGDTTRDDVARGKEMFAALPRPWCQTCANEHVANMPAHTWVCDDCGFGAWSYTVAAGHQAAWPEHTVRAKFHDMTGGQV